MLSGINNQPSVSNLRGSTIKIIYMFISDQTEISRKESGNVLFLILIAVVLFGALTYAATSSSRIGSNSLSDEQAAIVAAELVQQVNVIRLAYQRLRVGGCLLEEMDLGERPNNATYRRNPLAPSASGDYSCSLFHPDGGKQIADNVPMEIFESENTALDWSHATSLRVTGVGKEDVFELSLIIPGLVRENVCRAFNSRLLGTDEIPIINTNLDTRTYDGTFPVTNWDRLSDPLAFGQHAGCVETDYSGERKYGIYAVLEPR